MLRALRSQSVHLRLVQSWKADHRCFTNQPNGDDKTDASDDDRIWAGSMSHTDSYVLPWVRSIIAGMDLMRHPKYNKGLAFQNSERDKLYLRGLLPPAVLTLETQIQRVMINVRNMGTDLERNNYLMSLQDRNERLFFTVVRKNLEELLPVVHLPTVRQACSKYGLMFRSLPKGLFLTQQDVGMVRHVLKNWPERRVKIIMITDGEEVGPCGDLGVHAVNAAISKLSLCTSVGGVNPGLCLPIITDFGTNNDELLKSQFYVGLKHKRLTGDIPDLLMHELMDMLEHRYGNNVMIFFEDMKYANAQKLLSQYRTRFPCFADDYEGFATAVLAGLLGALPDTALKLSEHRILILGDGAHRVSVADMLGMAIAKETKSLVVEARCRMWLADSHGLVTSTSPHHTQADIDHEVLLYAKDDACQTDITEIVERVKPTIIISCSSDPEQLTKIPESAVRAMSKHCERPLIMALSSPTAELSAAEAYHWSGGKAMYASFEGPQEEVFVQGKTMKPSKVQSVYIFPGLALGTCVSRSCRIRHEQLLAAAKAVAAMTTDEDRQAGRILPPMSEVHTVALEVAHAVAKSAYDLNIASNLPKPHDLRNTISQYLYDPQYRHFR